MMPITEYKNQSPDKEILGPQPIGYAPVDGTIAQ